MNGLGRIVVLFLSFLMASQALASGILQLDFTRGTPPAVDSRSINDAAIKLLDRHGSASDVFVVGTKEFLRQVLTWKSGFVIYKQEYSNRLLIALTVWRNPERDSSHALIRAAMNYVTGTRDPQNFETLPNGLREIARGYVKAAGGSQVEVYDLVGAPIYSYSGFYGKKLSDGAELVKDAFFSRLSLVVDFPAESDDGFDRRKEPEEISPEDRLIRDGRSPVKDQTPEHSLLLEE